jgi:ferredoxin--NADP+ reductase
MFDRLPTPFGLVRHGVAPDHEKIKSVTKVYDRIAEDPCFRFFGYVELGKDIQVADLRQHYHQIIYATGAQTDRNLNIPGIELERSRTATEFVAWYNGHPDFRHYTFDLSQERVAVVGVGNVAMDVARILLRSPQELATTDIADYALEALSKSNVKEVILMGRRGPAQAAFTPPEIREMGHLLEADVIVSEEDATPDPLSQAWLDDLSNRDAREARKNVETLQEYAQQEPTGKPKKLIIKFLVSPIELIGNNQDEVAGMKVVCNELYENRPGSMRPRATDRVEIWPVDLVFRSIGYEGVRLEGVPFRDDWSIIPNEAGRICDLETGRQVIGEYVTGWIKRGPSGIIGTNKPDAVETVKTMLEDLADGNILFPPAPDWEAARNMVQKHQPQYFSYEDWQLLDSLEVARGDSQGRPRVKFVTIEEMLEAAGKQ